MEANPLPPPPELPEEVCFEAAEDNVAPDDDEALAAALAAALAGLNEGPNRHTSRAGEPNSPGYTTNGLVKLVLLRPLITRKGTGIPKLHRLRNASRTLRASLLDAAVVIVVDDDDEDAEAVVVVVVVVEAVEEEDTTVTGIGSAVVLGAFGADAEDDVDKEEEDDVLLILSLRSLLTGALRPDELLVADMDVDIDADAAVAAVGAAVADDDVAAAAAVAERKGVIMFQGAR
jgi:hypothetical protein